MSVQEAAQNNTEAVVEEEVPSQTVTETKTGEQVKVESEAKDEPEKESNEPAKEPEGKKEVPESYDLKKPEGSLLDATRVEAIASFAKSKGLSTDAAQALVEYESEAIEQLATKNQKVWLEELRNDKDFGGQSLEDNGALAFQTAEKWFGEEFVNLMKSTHLNNHPLLFRGLVRIAKASANDKFVHSGSQDSGGTKSDAELFYGPSTNKE